MSVEDRYVPPTGVEGASDNTAWDAVKPTPIDTSAETDRSSPFGLPIGQVNIGVPTKSSTGEILINGRPAQALPSQGPVGIDGMPTDDTSSTKVAIDPNGLNPDGKVVGGSEIEKAIASMSKTPGKFKPFIRFPAFEVNNALKSIDRKNTEPPPIEAWECRIGGSRFIVPPINISVNQQFKAGSMGGGLRQSSSPKFNSGHSETMISMTLYFPNHESIWGFEGLATSIDFDNAEDSVIDRFMSSLRGLIAQFKYAPFLPIENAYLNGTFGITSVAMHSMTVSTIEGYPFALAVNLNMLKFNHEVYLPMVGQLSQAMHWGRFRQYIGRAATKLNEIASKDFLETARADTSQSVDAQQSYDDVQRNIRSKIKEYYKNSAVVNFNKLDEISQGKNFEIYLPESVPTTIAYPDLSNFSATHNDLIGQKQASGWSKVINNIFGTDFNDDPDLGYESARRFSEVAGSSLLRNEARLLRQYIDNIHIVWNVMNKEKMDEYINERVRQFKADNPQASDESVNELKYQIKGAWIAYMYDAILTDPYLQNVFEYQEYQRGWQVVKEWEVPMKKLGLDFDNIFVQNVSVSLGNNLARLQLQLQDEPVHQHLGGLDTTTEVSMIVFGEDDLIKLRNAFQTIGGLARLTRGQGVIGFLGIKNVITSLCGMKYCIPQSFEVDTVDGFPHVYTVKLSLIDFDVFQQKREILSSEQQQEFIDYFSKANPFLRIKQEWAAFNAYPDFPLSVKDSDGKIVGYMDPDYYYKGYDAIDDDIVNWGTGIVSPIAHILSQNSVNKDVAEGLEVNPVGIQLHSGDKSSSVMAWNEMTIDTTRPETSVPTEGLAPPPSYANPHMDGSGNPSIQYQYMMRDAKFRDKDGRMVRAFPTYMLWIIDEGGNFAGVKLFDNFYGLQSVMDIAVGQSEDSMDETAVIQLSNLYSRLSVPYRDLINDNGASETAKIINTGINRSRNLASGLTDYLVRIDHIELKPGVRVHLRMGYSANPNALETVFNGTVTEVQQGEVVTITCQSDTVELSAVVNSDNQEGSSGKIDGAAMAGFWLSEPRDLMCRLLSMGSSTTREALAHASRGKIFSENRFGIRHFGMMLYEPMTEKEEKASNARNSWMGEKVKAAMGAAGSTVGAGGGAVNPATATADAAAQDIPGGVGNSAASDAGGQAGEVSGFVLLGMMDVFTSAVINSYKQEDYELFKRNIYPGNGSGLSQYTGGDIADGGLAIGLKPTGVSPDGTILDSSGATQVAPTTAEQIVGRPPTNRPNQKQVDDARDNQGLTENTISATQSAKGAFDEDGLFKFVPQVRLLAGGNAALHPFWKMIGVDKPGAADDDPEGADEISFRAQTFMKSVWDLFQVCAALLPNYIVAVRPFENRSTVFYGKPHWNYTSGVIPITTGPPKLEPKAPDPTMDDLMQQTAQGRQKYNEQGLSDLYKDTTSAATNADPNSSTGGLVWDGKDISSLPTEFDTGSGKAILPANRGGVVEEMHLGTKGNLGDGNPQNPHKQLDSLTPARRFPFYCDRDDVPGGGSGNDNIRGGVAGINSDPTKGDTVLVGENKDQNCLSGAFGYLSPEDEQYYMNMRWASPDMYPALRGTRILVYNTKSKKGVICTPGDYGPSGSTGLVAGISPDAAFTIDLANGDECIFGFVASTSPLGPVDFSKNGTDGTKVAATDPASSGTASSATSSGIPDWVGGEDQAIKDPAKYSMARGWHDTKVPVNFTDDSKHLVDKVGATAEGQYIGFRSPDDANEIWKNFRVAFRTNKGVNARLNELYPDLSQDKKDAIFDAYLKYMWSDGYNRGWLVRTADRTKVGIVGDVQLLRDGANNLPGPLSVIPGVQAAKTVINYVGDGADVLANAATGDNGKWSFQRAAENFEQWLDSPKASGDWMQKNSDPGTSAPGFFSSLAEHFVRDIAERVWNVLEDVRKSLGALGTGVISLIRFGIMQLTGGSAQASYNQKNANVLNRALNDSIYYQGGEPGSITRLVDNPFTREFQEPVIEIRQPFQRLHVKTSFSHIVSNNILENNSDIATVVTAVSNGEHPVTVHLDKGAPSEKQVERSVETGLYWDKPDGIPILRNILHAGDTLTNWAKQMNNGLDETSSKRVAAWHLKEGLKDIYGGEILVLGDAQIRPHDLIYLADVYERIFGICEVEQAIHHFNSDMGFVTSIVPNALVTIQDPARFSFNSYLRGRLTAWATRDAMRRSGYTQQDTIKMKDLVSGQMGDYLYGDIQYTGGVTSLVKDIMSYIDSGALANMGIGGDSGNPVIDLFTGNEITFGDFAGTAASGGGTFGFGGGKSFVGKVIDGEPWDTANTVRDKLLDQQACYIQFLTRDGKPMDAGLSGWNRGFAVGRQRVATLFKNSLRIPIPTGDTIRTDDLLNQIGWNPKDTEALVQDLDFQTNFIKGKLYNEANKSPEGDISKGVEAFSVRVVEVIDGDTIKVSPPILGQDRIRLNAIDAPEVSEGLKLAGPREENTGIPKNSPEGYPVNLEYALTHFPTDPGVRAWAYAWDNLHDKQVSIRINTGLNGGKDIYGRMLGMIFHNVTNEENSEMTRSATLNKYALSYPAIRWNDYLPDGKPYTFNWQMVCRGFANVFLFGFNQDNFRAIEGSNPSAIGNGLDPND